MGLEEIDRYQELYTQWAAITDFNLEERTKQVPSQKQFWSTRLMDAKRDKLKLERQKKTIKAGVLDKLLGNSPVSLSKKTLDQVEDSPQLEKINEKIEDIDMIILALEYIYKNVTFIANDIKNIIDCRRLDVGC